MPAMSILGSSQSEKSTLVKKIALEIKASSTPSVSKSFWDLLAEVQFDEAWVIAPVNEEYPLKEDVKVAPLHRIIAYLNQFYE